MLLPVIVTSCWHPKILIWVSEFLASCQCSAICWMALCKQSAVFFFFKSILYISSLPARESGFLVNVDRTPPSDSTAHSTNVSCPHLTSSPAAPYASVLHLVFPVLKFEKAFSIISKHCLVFVFCFFLHFKAPLWSGNLLCCACISRLIWSNILVNRGGGSCARQAKAKWELDYSCDDGKRDLNPLLCKYIREQCPLPYINVMTFGQESPSAPPSHTQTHNHMHL